MDGMTWHNARLTSRGEMWGYRARPAAPPKTMTYTLYGIKACDTMKKARTWLDEHAVSHEFHDYKTQGIDREHLTQWCNEHGWQVVLNRAGTTFRKLDDGQKADLDQTKAIELMLAQPSMIKRPALDLGNKTLIGFKPDLYAAALQ
ncbi:ArsC protein [Pseudomonas coronafaciens pv. garcae]|uniref:ArsC protein n=3 Tax=Pseudomonas syringae group TaxID=136849 RepID=A0AB37QI43_9PSED|nr:ArsC protein [Pseudomonas coronafaciens pv. garcae]RMS07087.1 ArsC protein [Pseudomonas coronafaciens pv. garcae]